MKAIKANWFECKMRYEQVQENGLLKKVTETYVVDAVSFADAEVRVIEEVAPYISAEYEVTDVRKAPYKEIFFMNGGEKVLANETEKLSRAMNHGRAAAKDQFDKPVDFNPANANTRWYKAKLEFITVDEKTGKEKRSAVTYLVEAASLHNALDNIDVVMKGTMIDYVQANVGETKIIDVFLHQVKEGSETTD